MRPVLEVSSERQKTGGNPKGHQYGDQRECRAGKFQQVTAAWYYFVAGCGKASIGAEPITLVFGSR
jgi:hypothetical protein